MQKDLPNQQSPKEGNTPSNSGIKKLRKMEEKATSSSVERNLTQSVSEMCWEEGLEGTRKGISGLEN